MSRVAEAQGPERAPQEQELRALLERGVPHLPAPAQRLEGVRERIRRRRRRRMAAVTGGAVLAVAAGLVGVPDLVRTQEGAPRAAHTAQVGPGAKATASLPEPTPTTTATKVGYYVNGMGFVDVTPPGGWRILTDDDTASLFLATPAQPLALPGGGCAHALDGFCTPLVRALGSGGALVMFKAQPGKVSTGKLKDSLTGVLTVEPYTACTAVGGTDQLSRTLAGLVDQDGSAVLVWATACMAHPSKALRAEVSGLLARANVAGEAGS